MHGARNFGTIAAVGCALWIASAAQANAASWEHETNSKGNGSHYLIVIEGSHSITFACRQKKAIAFYGIPLSELDPALTRIKNAYPVAIVDGDADGNGAYAWFSGTTEVSPPDLNVNFGSEQQVIKLLRDISAAEKDVRFGISTESPGKGRFTLLHSIAFPIDGAAEAIPEFLAACGFRP